jgi:RNA polymerase sigma-70 factor, ECF subfamily
LSEVDVRQSITQAHHAEWARVVAALTRRFGDLDIAEEAAAEAFATAVARWPVDGVPPNPGGWLSTTANRKAIDRIDARTSATTSRRRPRWSTTTTRPSLSAPSTTSGSG